MDLVGPIVNIVDGIVNRDLRQEQARAAQANAQQQIEQARQQTEQARIDAQKTQQMLLYGVAAVGIIAVGFVAYKMLGK